MKSLNFSFPENNGKIMDEIKDLVEYYKKKFHAYDAELELGGFDESHDRKLGDVFTYFPDRVRIKCLDGVGFDIIYYDDDDEIKYELCLPNITDGNGEDYKPINVIKSYLDSFEECLDLYWNFIIEVSDIINS